VRVYDDLRATNTRDVGLSVPELGDLRDKSGPFQDISVAFPVDANLTGGDHPDRVEFLGTNSSYFTLLGVRAQLGRVLVGYWIPEGAPAWDNAFICILAHRSQDEAKKNWDAMRTDSEFQAMAKSEQTDKLVDKVELTCMHPTDFSPMK
jgi:hypothetical protein